MGLFLLLLGGCSVEQGLLRVLAAEEEKGLVETYAAWSNGPSKDAGYFPIGVWLQSPANAGRYKEIGVNLYVGLWQGPTEEQLAALKAAGMQVICPQNAVGLNHLDDPTIIGWMHGDEPDNAQRQADGSWGAAVPPEHLMEDYQRWTERDPSRPVWLNLGQGVANDNWVGRAAPYEDYPRYIEATDIVSFDVYPVAGIRRDDGERFLWYVAKGVERLLEWGGGKPAWSVIETTRISSTRKATPHQVKAEVWMALIHGAKGIVYFAHEWNPRFVEARLLEDEEMRLGVADINAQIHRLAPVLNGEEVAVEVVSADEEIPVAAMGRRYEGAIYVFAVPMRLGAVEARFVVEGVEGVEGEGVEVEVVDEGRVVEVVDGAFGDAFGVYDVRVYRLLGGG